MKLSVLIVSYCSENDLEKCLESVRAWFSGVDYEIILVDNASTDQTVAKARGFSEVRIIAQKKNRGFACALNEALRAASGEYCLWLNPDTEIKNKGMAVWLRHMDEDPSIGISGARILNSDGSAQFSCRSFPGHHTAFFNRYSMLTRLFPSNPLSRRYLQSDFDHRQVRTIDWVSGACLLHRRSLIQNVGFLDEHFFMYCEDVDFCKRASLNGWKVVYDPALEVVHSIGGSGKRMRGRLIWEHHRSMWRYYKKHCRRNFFLDALTAAGIFVRCSIKLFFYFVRNELR